ncbi:LysE family translocator [Campylobacterota bacterium DY0563]
MSVIFAMSYFSFVMSISPGPVNMIIISSGISNGFKKTFLFISGATIGFTVLLAFISFGFSRIIEAFPNFLIYLSFLGSSFIIYMGYKIINSAEKIELEKNKSFIPKFYEGFLLQWLNPKAWIACVAGVSLFSSSTNNLILFIIIYFLVCYLCLSFWAIVGQRVMFLFQTQRRVKILNIIMGSLLILVALYLFYMQLIKVI